MAISKYDKKFEYGKILTEGDLNGMVDAINLSIDGVNNADAKSETAIKEATTAKNAVKTLEGLANSTEAMETLAGQVMQIEENKNEIEASKTYVKSRLIELGVVGSYNDESNIHISGNNVSLKRGTNYYIFTKDNSRIMIKYVPTEDEEYVVPDFGALVYNLDNNSILTRDYYKLEESDIILLFFNGREPERIIGGQWYNSSMQRLYRRRFDGFPLVSSIGTMNDGIGVEIKGSAISISLYGGKNYYVFTGDGKMIKYVPSSNEVYPVPNFGLLVYDTNDGLIKAIDYNTFKSSFMLPLLFTNAHEPHYICGGLWYNSAMQVIYKKKQEELLAEIKETTIVEEIDSTNAQTGRVSSDDGSITSGNESRYIEFGVIPNSVIDYNATTYSGAYGYAFFDEEGNFIKGVKTSITERVSVVAPDLAKKMRLSWNANYVKNPNIVVDKYGLTKYPLSEIGNNFFIKEKDLIVYRNIIKKDDILLRQYVRANGTTGSVKDWCCTDYIPVESGEVYTAFDYKTTHVALYDSSKSIITDKTWQSGEVIPEGVSYIRLNQSTPDASEITIDKVTLALVKGIEDVNPHFLPEINAEKLSMPSSYATKAYVEKMQGVKQPFKGEGVFFAGDSQTMRGLYFNKFLEITGMKMIGNTGQLGNGGGAAGLVGFIERMDNEGLIDWESTKVFTVLIGGNDYGSNTALGSYDDKPRANTIYGGIKGVIDYVMGKNKEIRMAIFTRPERDNVENNNNVNGYWFTTKKLSGITQVTYTGSSTPTQGKDDGGISVCGYDSNGNFLKNILLANEEGYINKDVPIPADCKMIRICSKGSAAGVTFSFTLTTDGTSIPNGTTITENNIDEYREKQSNVLPKGYILNNSYYNIYIWKDGYCDNRSYHYAPGKNLAGNTMYEIGEAICDCAKRKGVACLDTHNLCNITYETVRDYMPDGTHFEKELSDRIGTLMGNFVNTLA